MSNSFNERLANLSKQIYEEELRIDPTDFEEYTQAEFLEFYGGLDEWKYARRVRKGEKRPMVCAIDPATAKSMKESVRGGRTWDSGQWRQLDPRPHVRGAHRPHTF